MSQPPTPQRICLLCQRPMNLQEDTVDPDRMHEFSDSPCSRCMAFVGEGGYIFVSISNKSEPPHKINRTGYCWEVEEEEVHKTLGKEHEIVQSSQNVVFVRHDEAKALGLLTGEQYDELEERYNPEARQEEE